MRRRCVVTLLAAFLPGAFFMSAIAQSDRAMLRVGWLALAAPSGNEDTVQGLIEGLESAGFKIGRNLQIERRHANGIVNALPGHARELIALGADVIIASGTEAALTAKAATQSIPIVLVAVGAPVETGLVRSLAAPGGNVTGPSAAYADIAVKWLELVLETVPIPQS